jgi:hypothetical protein
MDPFKQARAIALLHFPCPPLPVMGNFNEELREYSIINSHDMLSVFIISAFKRQDPEANARRKARQIELHDQFINSMHLITHPDCDFSTTYAAMATFTRNYLQSYHEDQMDIRVLDFTSIPPGMQRAIGDYLKAQCIINGKTLCANELNLSNGLYGGVQPLLKRCLECIFERQQGIVSPPVFEGVDEDVSEESEYPAALKGRVEVLSECVEPTVGS